MTDHSNATVEDGYLQKLKAVRKMEREAKDMFGKYMTALNENNNQEDIVQVLEDKITALKAAESLVIVISTQCPFV